MKRVWLLSAVFLLSIAFSACSGGDSNEITDAVTSDIQSQDLTGEDGALEDDVLDDVLPNEEFDPFDELRQGALQALIDEHVLFSADPGIAVAITTDEGQHWEGAAGISNLQEGTPMGVDTGFRVGSNTKPFVATVVLQLVDEEVLGLEDPLSDYFPEYTGWADITIRQLLNMRGGIPDYLGSTEFMLGTIENPGVVMTPAEILAFVKDEPLQFVPGEAGQYNNSNYLLLGMIIEQVTGNTVQDELDSRLFEPLQLDETFLDVTGEVYDYVAHGYMDLNLVGQIFGVPPSVIAFIPEENVYEGSIVDCSYLFHPSITWAAGALVSSTPNMEKFMRALLHGELLSPETQAEMEDTKEITLLGGPVQYGLGLQVRPTLFGDVMGHGGLNFGYQAGTYYHKESGVTFSHMHNYLPEQSDSFQNSMLDIVINGVNEVPPVCEPPEGFFDGTEGMYLQARFKGEINSLDAEVLVGGVNFWNLTDGEDVNPLYGWGSTASKKFQAFQDRLSVDSYSPSTNQDVELQATTINMAVGVFDKIDEDGYYTLSDQTPGELYVTMADLDTDELSNPLKLCFTAVYDLTRPSKVYFCDPEATADAGAELKFYASIAMEDDIAKVEEVLATLGVPRCLCIDEEGAWGVCPEPTD